MEMPTRYAMTAVTRYEGLGGIRGYAVPQASAIGHWTPYDEAVQLEAQRDAALARLKELEALAAEQRLVIAGWTETAATQQARIAKLKLYASSGVREEIDVADDACSRVVARYKEDATIPGATWLEDRLKRLAELEILHEGAGSIFYRSVRATAQAHGWLGGEPLVRWLEVKLIDLASVRDRLAERLLPVAREHGYEDNSESLGDWLEKLIRHFASDRQLSHLAQSFRNSDPGPAGESLEQWLTDRLQLLAHLQVLLHRVQKMGKI
jgi:hypothetical protein